MTAHHQFNRREFLKFTGLGVATSSLYACGLLSSSGASYRVYDFAGQHWQPYKESIVIDGLAGAIDVKNAELSSDTLATFVRSGVTAINDTIAYPGDNFAQANDKVDKAIAQIARYNQQLKLIESVDEIGRASCRERVYAPV